MAVPYQPTYTLNPKYGFRYGPSTFGPTTTNLTSPPPVGLDGSSAAPPPVLGSQEGQYNQSLDGGNDYLQDQQTQQQNQARITQAQSYGYTQGVQNPSSLVRAVPVVGNFIADSISPNTKYNYGTSGTYDAEGNVFDSSGRAYDPITGAPAQSYAKATGEDSWLGNWIGFGTEEGMFGPSSSYGKLRNAGEDPINSFFGSYDNSVYKQMDANPNLTIQGAREARRRGFASPIENLTFDITQNTMNAQTDEFGNLPTGPVWGTNPGDYIQSDQGPLQVTEGGQLKGPDGSTTVMVDGVSFVNTDITDYANLNAAQKAIVDNRTSVDNNTYATDTTSGDAQSSVSTTSTSDPSMGYEDDPWGREGDAQSSVSTTSTSDPSMGYNDDPWGRDTDGVAGDAQSSVSNTSAANNASGDDNNSDGSSQDPSGMDGGYDFSGGWWSTGGEIPAELSIDNIKNMGNMMNVKKYSQKDRYGNEMSVEFYDVPDMKVPDHPGGPKGTDTVPAWLTPGEFVMNAEATRMFEPQIEQMNNAGRAVQAQQGGTIPEYAANGGPIYAATGGNSGFLADILKRLEGVKGEAYLDSAGKPTIGAGSTRGVQMGDTASDDQIDSMLAEDIAVVDQDYRQLVSADLNPNQEAAVKSLLFNIGGPQFANSKARAALNAGDFDSFKKEAAEFRKVGDKVIPGLENRRAQEIALFDSPVGEDPWGINRRQVSTVAPADTARDARAAKLVAAGQPTDLAMQAAILGQDAETTGETVTPPPIDRGPPPSMAMMPAEDILALQQQQREAQAAGTYEATSDVGDPFPPEPAIPGPDAEMLAAQKATREQGMYDPDGVVAANEAGAEQARILEEQRRMQQGQVPPIEAAPPADYGDEFGNIPDAEPADTRNWLRKIGDRGGLSTIVKEKYDQFEADAEKKAAQDSILKEQRRMQQGQVPSTDPAETPPPETGTYGVHNTIIRPDAEGQDRTYKWDAKREAYIDEAGLEYTRGPGELVSGLFTEKPPVDDQPDQGDTQIGTLNGSPVYMGKDGQPYVMEDLGKLGIAAGTKRMNVQPWQTDNIKLLPKADRKVAGPKTPGPKDGLIDLPGTGAPPPVDTPPVDKPTTTTPPTSKSFDGPKPPAAEVAKDVKAIDDGSAKGTKPGEAEAAVKQAGSEGTDKVNKAESWLAETFSGLFDAQELKRMAILYAGSRLMGNSHAGSLNWAAEGYLDRVSAHEANVQKLIEKGEYTPASIQNFKKTKDYSTLIKTGTPIAPTGTKETWYTPSGKRVQAEKYKTGKDSYVWSYDGGRTAIPSSWHQDASRVKNTDEYNDRIIKESNYLAERLAEIDESSGNKIVSGSIKAGDRKTSYVTGLRPKDAASQVARWAAANGVDVASAEGYARQAWEMAVADAQADPEKRKKPSDLRPYLNQLKIRQDTGINELFDITAEDGTITKMDSEKIEEVSRNYLARKGLSGGVSEGDLVKNDTTGFTTRRNRNEVNNFWTEASSRWAKKVAENPGIVDEWAGKAIAGETPFFAWAKANVMK